MRGPTSCAWLRATTNVALPLRLYPANPPPMRAFPDPLPIDEALPRLTEALHGRSRAVLVAPPGAGKTTVGQLPQRQQAGAPEGGVGVTPLVLGAVPLLGGEPLDPIGQLVLNVLSGDHGTFPFGARTILDSLLEDKQEGGMALLLLHLRGKLELDAARDPKKAAIIGTFTRTPAGKEPVVETTRIALDPESGLIRSWVFEDSGAYHQAYWHGDGKSGVLDCQGVLPDATPTAERIVLKRVSPDAITWQAIDRVVGDTDLADTPPMLLTRVPASK